MKLWWRLAVAVLAGVWLSGFASAVRTAAQGQAPAATQTRKAGEVFKNVTTDALKELSVDDFIGAMGVIADDLGLDCAIGWSTRRERRPRGGWWRWLATSIAPTSRASSV